MKIFNANQIRAWDDYTINHEPILSIDLMERAATSCVQWIRVHFPNYRDITIICGRGNNGGDGLAIGRLLHESGYNIKLFVLEGQKYGSAEFESNLLRYKEIAEITFINSILDLSGIISGEIIIDALFGTGLSKPVEGLVQSIVEYINSSDGIIISIDVPSGLFTDSFQSETAIIKATHTLSFQQVKFSFLLPESICYTGSVHILDIGLSKDYYYETKSSFEYLDRDLIKSIYRKRLANSNKGTYGHSLIVAGSYGMMGAAVLSVKACLKSGAGKVTAIVPKIGYKIMQISAPEAMVIVSGKRNLGETDSLENYNSIGIGPGIGRNENYKDLLYQVFSESKKPVVIDADALYQLGLSNELFENIPAGSILTPHPKEFEHLFGASENGFSAIEIALMKAASYNIFIILKGHYTFIACPDGRGYFNSTGNAGMATGGSGDVLTGIITGLLAQGYNSQEAAILGIYLHGKAGDLAALSLSEEALIAGDIVNYMGQAFLEIGKY